MSHPRPGKGRSRAGVVHRAHVIPQTLRELKECILLSKVEGARSSIRKLMNSPGAILHYRAQFQHSGKVGESAVRDHEPGGNATVSVGVENQANDINLLQLASTHLDASESEEVLDLLQEMIVVCPKLLKIQRTGCYEGQTAVHILVARGNTESVRTVFRLLTNEARKSLFQIQAKGKNFKGTVMMGELPLSVAALTFKEDMVSCLLNFKANLQGRNSQGDNVFHSLIRFSQCYEDHEPRVIRMMTFLHDKIREESESLQVGDVGTDKRSMWLMENNEGLTPLKLAAQLLQWNIFKFIIDLDGVYTSLDDNDGLFDFLYYDTTEIDPVASRIARSIERRGNNNNSVDETTEVSRGLNTGEQARTAQVTKVSVLEIVHQARASDSKSLFGILGNFVVAEVIKRKWKKYRPFFLAWLVLHIIFMALFTWYVITKREIQVSNATSWKSSFVLAMSVIMFIWALLLVAWEEVRRTRMSYVIKRHHSIGLARINLTIYALCILADCVWYWVSGPNGVYIAVVALTTGWWFCTFFLRPFKMFSFFTVMVNKVLFGDLLRFVVVLFFLYVAFTSAMYITFVTSPRQPEGFDGFWNSSVTMFRLMLGLTEADVLNEAADPWLAVVLYVAYVLLTYVLILTSLFALMSDTASRVAEDRVGHWLMQMLAVVLCMEASLPRRYHHPVGRKKVWVRYDSVAHQRKDEDRYAIKILRVKDRNRPGEGSAIDDDTSDPFDRQMSVDSVQTIRKDLNSTSQNNHGNSNRTTIGSTSSSSGRPATTGATTTTTTTTTPSSSSDNNGGGPRESVIRNPRRRKPARKSTLHDLLYTYKFQFKYGNISDVVEPYKVDQDSKQGFGSEMLRKEKANIVWARLRGKKNLADQSDLADTSEPFNHVGRVAAASISDKNVSEGEPGTFFDGLNSLTVSTINHRGEAEDSILPAVNTQE